MGWKFEKTEAMMTSGANNQAFETFNEDGSIIREIIQNSLDAKRDECDHVEVEIELSLRQTSDFPGKAVLNETLYACKKQFEESDRKSTNKILDMIKTLENDSHYVVSFRDLNTKGLEGGLEECDQSTNLYQLVYGDGTTNKNTSKSSGGSFGIGKIAPFTRSNIKSVFYDTHNIAGDEIIVGKSIFTSHRMDGYKRTPYGFYKDDGKIRQYLGELAMNKRMGTCVHIPFYKMKDDNVQSEVNIILRDVLVNFMLAIYRGKLIVRFINNITDNIKEVSKNNLSEMVDEVMRASTKGESKYLKIKTMHNLLTNDKVLTDTIYFDKDDSSNYIELYMALGENSTGFKRYFNLREQLMLIEDKKIRGKYFKFDGMAIYHGIKLNNVLRDAEPPEHNKWKVSSLRTTADSAYFNAAKKALENRMIELFGDESSDKIVLKEFNNDIFSENKEYEEVYKIKKLSENSQVRKKADSKKTVKAKLYGTDRKVEKKDKMNNKSNINDAGNTEVGIIVHTDVTKKIRSKGNGRYIVTLKEGYSPKDDEIQVYSRTDTGKEERLTGRKILRNENGKVEVMVNDIELDIFVLIEEKHEA